MYTQLEKHAKKKLTPPPDLKRSVCESKAVAFALIRVTLGLDLLHCNWMARLDARREIVDWVSTPATIRLNC